MKWNLWLLLSVFFRSVFHKMLVNFLFQRSHSMTNSRQPCCKCNYPNGRHRWQLAASSECYPEPRGWATGNKERQNKANFLVKENWKNQYKIENDTWWRNNSDLLTGIINKKVREFASWIIQWVNLPTWVNFGVFKRISHVIFFYVHVRYVYACDIVEIYCHRGNTIEKKLISLKLYTFVK